MNKLLLLGDEAGAQGAIDAGISTAYGYPGTPSTEIFEYIMGKAEGDDALHATWAANEKVAMEEAVGTSFAGRRSVVTMKHVGLNVAADPFMNAAITGAGGGLVVMVADDPGMHSSQNEQDSRYFASFAYVPCLEPATQQEAYDMARAGFDLSEQFELPVLMRYVTRLAHSRAPVEVGERRAPNPVDENRDRSRWTLLPSNSRVRYKGLLETYEKIKAHGETSDWNPLVLNDKDRKLGVIAAGVGYNYFREVAGDNPPSYLKVGLYPVPTGKVRRLLDHCEKVIVIEDGYPFIERTLSGDLHLGEKGPLLGRFTGHLPTSGELNPEIVKAALAGEPVRTSAPHDLIRPRPPQLCRGCPHRDTFEAINVIKKKYPGAAVPADIGCYTLGFYPPFSTIDSCLDMGASISMAKGASDAGVYPVLCVIGDSTFGHSGITPLLTAAHENTDITVVIVDNTTTAMTGTQESLTTGDRLVEICAGVGVEREHIRVIKPLAKNHEENVKVFEEEVAHEGLSVIISRRKCIQVR